MFEKFTEIDAKNNKVLLDNKKEIPYDILIVASGCDICPSETPGLESELWQKSIYDFYTFDGACKLAGALENFKEGRLVVHITEMPIKCPVAPLEFVFLADSYFRKKGLRDKVDLYFVTPLSGAFTKPKATEVLSQLLKRKNIHVIPEFNIEMVDVEKKEIVSYDGTRAPFDLLVTIPTNMGSGAIERSGLGDELNFIPIDKQTLQANEYKNIFSIGDASDAPASKAGSVAHFQSDILLENILSYIEGQPLKARFDGHANCFIETGDEMALLIDFNYETEPLEGSFPLPFLGPMSLLKESRLNHWGKLGFRWV